jgi:ABC-type glycerol-3-phosphate transport system permease component
MAAVSINKQNPLFANFMARFGMTILHLVLLGVGLIYIFPFIWMVGSAFKTNGEFFTQGANPFPSGEWQVGNFIKAWETAKFSVYFGNTLVTSVAVTVFVVIFTSMAGYALTRLPVPGKKYLLLALGALFFLPAGYTIIPVLEIVKALGLLNSLWAIIVTGTAGGMLFNTFLFAGYMRTIPSELEEAAIIDGATVWQRFWNVVFPLSRPMIATVALFTFMSNWNSFFGPLVFTLGRPELRTLAVGMYAFQGQNSADWVGMCMGATISIIPIIVVYVLLQRHFIAAFAGAIKS